jgi:hypothetical protein
MKKLWISLGTEDVMLYSVEVIFTILYKRF